MPCARRRRSRRSGGRRGGGGLEQRAHCALPFIADAGHAELHLERRRQSQRKPRRHLAHPRRRAAPGSVGQSSARRGVLAAPPGPGAFAARLAAPAAALSARTVQRFQTVGLGRTSAMSSSRPTSRSLASALTASIRSSSSSPIGWSPPQSSSASSLGLISVRISSSSCADACSISFVIDPLPTCPPFAKPPPVWP